LPCWNWIHRRCHGHVPGISILDADPYHDAVHSRVTVIIPAYNAARFLKETIDSVFAQTFSGLELLVIDDGSTDSTGDIVRDTGIVFVMNVRITAAFPPPATGGFYWRAASGSHFSMR